MTHRFVKRTVFTESMDITDEVARSLVVEARINSVDRKLDAFEQAANSVPSGMLNYLFSIDMPEGWSRDFPSQHALLEYVRNNIPPDTTFGYY